jgi:hypothetical protein
MFYNYSRAVKKIQDALEFVVFVIVSSFTLHF